MFRIVNSRNGLFLLNENDSIISKELIQNGVWEEYLLDFAEKNIKDDSVVIDAGANIGTMCVPFSKFKKGVTVHAFEPSRVLYNQMCGNLFLNNSLNVTPHRKALSNKRETLYYEEINIQQQNNYGDNRMFGGECQITAVPLDSLEFEKKVSFIKVDCQGYDLQVLYGAKEILRKDSPVVVMEWEEHMAKELNHSFDDVLKYMKEMGYTEINKLYHNDWFFKK